MEMEKLVSLCKRRGFLFQSSEIYGGLNGFWDYGPLGVELKRNIKEAWWRDMVSGHDDLAAPPGAPQAYEMTGLDCSIIMHPQVWKVSGHYDLFHDFMVDCKETKKRYRHDQVRGRWVEYRDQKIFVTTMVEAEKEDDDTRQRALKFFKLRAKDADELKWQSEFLTLPAVKESALVLGPDAKELGTLTDPREFNLMFKTFVGALSGEEGAAFLRPETAQGIFVNFKNVVDSTRLRVPFGIAQSGKSFRNEITPRNFTFRSREFEQMEIEFFCHPNQSAQWYQYWRDRRMKWYTDLGLSSERLRLREHHAEELSHYSCGTSDIEYAFPFLPAGDFGELEGIAHRGDFDLRSHMEGKLDPSTRPLIVELGPDGKPKWRGSGKDLSYRDELTNERFVPHVIEPAAGATRTVMAFLMAAYDEEEVRGETRTVLRLHPRLAPYKVAVLPLSKKPELATEARKVLGLLQPHFMCDYDETQAIGRRYRRQDELGTPFCVTFDFDSLDDKAVTVRERDSMEQERVPVVELVERLRERLAL